MKKIIKIIHKYLHLISQGVTFKDKLIIFCYFLKTPIHLIKKKLNIPYSRKLLGNVTVKSKDGIFFCGNNIFTVWTGSSFHELELRKYFDIKKGVFLDIGANIGKFSIIVGRNLVDKGKVISFEPHPENFKILVKNIELNKLENVTPFKIACSDSDGEFSLYLDEDGTGGHSIVSGDVNTHSKAGKKEIKIKTVKLDDILKKIGVEKVDLIKIDVEGAEAKVLEGGLKTLKKSHPKIIFEAWDQENLKEITKILKKFNYRIKKIDSDNYFAY